MTTRLHSMTMPEFLEARYDSRGLKIFSALVIFIFLVPYSASVYMGLSYLFNQIFGIPYIYAAFAMCLLTAMYLVMGGYRALTMTDVFQGVVMLFGIGMLLYFVVGAPEVGGRQVFCTAWPVLTTGLLNRWALRVGYPWFHWLF